LALLYLKKASSKAKVAFIHKYLVRATFILNYAGGIEYALSKLRSL
jgi:hypothetical protein